MKFGVNGYSMIRVMSNDFEEAALKLKEGGASYLEPMVDWGAKAETIEVLTKQYGKVGWDPENTLKRLEYLRSIGMDIKGFFVFFEDLENQAEDLGKYCKNAGIEYIVMSFAGYNDIDDVYKKIQMLKKVSAILKSYGVLFILHNHEYEFVTMVDKDGVEKYVMDIILGQCSAEELMLEIDTGWLVYAGIEPAQYIKDNIERIAILHFKDMCKGFKDIPRKEIFLACGEGVVDFKGILEAIPEGKKDQLLYVLDQDDSKCDIIADNIKSIQYLNNLVK